MSVLYESLKHKQGQTVHKEKQDMKTKSEKKTVLIIATINGVPKDDEDQMGDVESQNINKDPIIGGADDVYRENPTEDLRDSDLIDAEPLQEDTDYEDERTGQLEKIQEIAADRSPTDSEEENMNISNLDDNEDILDED